MRYGGSLTVPAGTVESDPATAVLEVVAGTISQVEVLFPPGSSGLVSLQVWCRQQQVWPTTFGHTFIGDDRTVTFYDEYEITELPYQLTLVGWAPATVLPHTVYVDVSMLPPRAERRLQIALATLPVM